MSTRLFISMLVHLEKRLTSSSFEFSIMPKLCILLPFNFGKITLLPCNLRSVSCVRHFRLCFDNMYPTLPNKEDTDVIIVQTVS